MGELSESHIAPQDPSQRLQVFYIFLLISFVVAIGTACKAMDPLHSALNIPE